MPKLTFSVAAEWFKDVSDAHPDQFGTISTRSGSVVSDKISVPFTLAWTSEKDLFTIRRSWPRPWPSRGTFRC